MTKLANTATQLTCRLSSLTVYFLPIFVPKHAVIIKLLLSDVYFVLGREGFWKGASSFRHFGREKVQSCFHKRPHLLVAGKMQGNRQRPNHTHPLWSRGNSTPIQHVICSDMIGLFYKRLPNTSCCLHGLTQSLLFEVHKLIAPSCYNTYLSS